jgi:copper chaperone CopZ
MNSRYLQFGVIAVGVVLIAAAIISAKSDPGSQQDLPRPAETTTGTQAAIPGKTTPLMESVSSQIASKAVLDVQGMSCSGCIYTIKSSLAGIDGVGEVLVDVSGGRVEVFYDESKLGDVGRIATAISASGYPAALKQTLTKAEIENENSYLDARSEHYIIAVGDWDISRDEYSIELSHARKRYEKVYGKDVFNGSQGDALLQRLKSQVVSRLINEGIQMQEIHKSGFKLASGTVELEFNDYLSQKDLTMDQFQGMLASSGYDYPYFLKKFENQITVNRYLDQNVFNGVSTDVDKQQQYRDWFNNARLLAKVVFYDRQLETIVKNSSGGSGCGSSCTKK